MEDTQYRLKLQAPKKDTRKVTYRVQRFVQGKEYRAPKGVWRMTLIRLEWFPRNLTWRLIETRMDRKPAGQHWWRQITLADFGNIPEAHACEVAIPTLRMFGH